MDSLTKLLYLILFTSFSVLYLVFTTFSRTVHFSQLNITMVVGRKGKGLDFRGDYVVDTSRKTVRKRGEEYYNLRTRQSFGPGCNTQVKLEAFGPQNALDKQMFFLETSGRSKLSPRQACSVEAAAKFSNLHVQVVLVSSSLDLLDNSTCYLYKTVSNISFYTVDLQQVFMNTPLQNIVNSNKFTKSKFKTTHQSDALRLALIFKYGGFYSDLDTVTIQDLSKLNNIIGSTKTDSKADTLVHLANGEFHFEKKHQLLWETMKMFKKVYTGKVRVEVGPLLITSTVKNYFHTDSLENVKSEILTVCPIQTFYPIKSFEPRQLWPAEPRSFTEWATLFENSSMVHFYASQTNKWLVEGDPSHEAYAVIAPRYCPVSLRSSNKF